MALTLRRKLAPSEYIPASQCDIERDAKGKEVKRTPRPGAAVFRIRPLTDFECQDVIAKMRFDGDLGIHTGSSARLCLMMGLIGWTGVNDEEGKPLPITAAAIELLGAEDFFDVAREIIEISRLTETERKN